MFFFDKKKKKINQANKIRANILFTYVTQRTCKHRKCAIVRDKTMKSLVFIYLFFYKLKALMENHENSTEIKATNTTITVCGLYCAYILKQQKNAI